MGLHLFILLNFPGSTLIQFIIDSRVVVKMNSFIRFFGENVGLKKSFRFCLTFTDKLLKTPWKQRNGLQKWGKIYKAHVGSHNSARTVFILYYLELNSWSHAKKTHAPYIRLTRMCTLRAKFMSTRQLIPESHIINHAPVNVSILFCF